MNSTSCRAFLVWAKLAFLLFMAEAAAVPDSVGQPAQQDDPNQSGQPLLCGTARVDITPPELPVIRNGGFLQAVDDRVLDPLSARCVVLGSGDMRLAILLVDSCMIPLELCDEAKRMASRDSGIPESRILIAATHNHSSPSSMDYCLGTNADPRYVRFLPHRLAEAVTRASAGLQPCEVAWGQVDASEFTANRRWIYRRDKPQTDPFGRASVLANMHPGHNNPDVVGPSGPEDPWLGFLSIRSLAGEHVALIANFSMHYFGGHPGISADYFGAFADGIRERIAPGSETFVGMMTQGTSGDLWWGDYSLKERQLWSLQEYTGNLLDMVEARLEGLEYRSDPPLAMAERRMTLSRRLPDETTLQWARETLAAMDGPVARNRPEVYAIQAIYIHENPEEDIVLQAVRIGDFGIAAWPNEVYALSGLKIKYTSPFAQTMNIELANGASGYIPPAEQHALGGYTTWPARTAGLEIGAEKKIVSTLRELLTEVSGKPLKHWAEVPSALSRDILRSRPAGLWRLGDTEGPSLENAVEGGTRLLVDGKAAFHLPGAPLDGIGEAHGSRSIHLVDASLTPAAPMTSDALTVEMMIWPGPVDRLESEIILETSRGNLLLTPDGNLQFDSAAVPFESGRWHHLALTMDATHSRLFLDGRSVARVVHPQRQPLSILSIGKGFQGKIDELALYQRALDSRDILGHWISTGLRDESSPLPPDMGLNSILVPDGFRIELVAAEPQTMDPVAFDWDRNGNLWVVEMADYPYGIGEDNLPGGRIRFLSDLDNDGYYETGRIFAEGLNFPNGILTWKDGVIVTAAPDILFLRDTDGDGKADSTEKLVTGLTEGNQQLRANGLRWGLDNMVHVAAGGHHSNYGINNTVESTRSGRSIRVGSRDFRFDPESGFLEPESGPSQFGRNRDDWGNWFGTQNSRPLWHYVLPDRYLSRNPDYAAPDGRVQLPGPVNPPLFQASRPQKRFHSFEQGGHFTSACSGMIHRGGLLFPMDETHAFSCDPFHNIVQHLKLEDDGFSFTATRVPHSSSSSLDFFASRDRWCRPVMIRNGPDGALYVADMYRYMIEHPDWLPENGREELKPFYRAGEKHGRIYRITRDQPHSPHSWIHQLRDANTPEDIANILESPDGWLRDKAHQILVHDPSPDQVIRAVQQLLKRGPQPLAIPHALGILEKNGAITRENIEMALNHAHPGVRRTGLKLTENHYSSTIGDLAAAMTSDPDPKVRLQLAFSCGAWPEKSHAGRVLAQLSREWHGDRFMEAAVMSSVRPHLAAFIDEVDGHLTTPMALSLLRSAGNESASLEMAVAESILRRCAAQASPQSLRTASRIIDSLRQADGRIFSQLKSSGTYKAAITRAQECLDLTSPENHRTAVEAAGLLIVTGDHSRRATTFLMEHLADDSGETNWPRSLELLGQSPDNQSPHLRQFILSRSLALGPRRQQMFLSAVFENPGWAQWVLDEITGGSYPATLVFPHFRAQLEKHRNDSINRAINTMAPALQENNPVSAGIEDYKQALTRHISDASTTGAVIYETHCARCHSFKGRGTAIGPALETVSAHDPLKILTNIIHPNADIQPGYHVYSCSLRDGSTLQGILISENASSITMKAADNSETRILRQDIDSIVNTGFSLMPEGLDSLISPDEMASLIHFLRNP